MLIHVSNVLIDGQLDDYQMFREDRCFISLISKGLECNYHNFIMNTSFFQTKAITRSSMLHQNSCYLLISETLVLWLARKL